MSKPGKVCCVLHCKQKGVNKNVSYHMVPSIKKKALRQTWLKTIRRRDYLYHSFNHIFVCSHHFKDSDFKIGRANGHRYLKEGTVPSIFEWNFKQLNPTITDNFDEGSLDLEPIVKDILSGIIDHVEYTLDDVTRENDVGVEVIIEDSGSSHPDCDCFKKLDELQALIEELQLQVAVQKRIIEVNDFKLRKVEKELKTAKKHRVIAEERLKDAKPSIEKIKDSNDDIMFYTGLPSYDKLTAVYNRLNPGPNGENIIFWNGGIGARRTMTSTSPAGRPRKLKVEDQFLLVLMRLRLGLFLKDLADRFGVATSTASNICITWINFMYFRLGQINIWPTREDIDETMPEDFKRSYPKTRVILDATELKCQASKSLVLQSGTYSNYKSTNTFKGLLGISPNGYVTFVSHLFTGCISDQEITRRSGFLSLKFSPNDSVMCDKGFLIKEMLNKKGVELNMPPFLGEKGQFTKAELEETQKIAALRIHVERRIARIRGFHILDRPVPYSLAPVINQLWTVITLLSNFQNTIIKNTEQLNDSSETINHYDEILEPGNSTWNDDFDEFEEEILQPEYELEDESDFEISNHNTSKDKDTIIPVINLDMDCE